MDQVYLKHDRLKQVTIPSWAYMQLNHAVVVKWY